MPPELKVCAVVCNRAVTWELVEIDEPFLLPLVPEFDWGSEFIERAHVPPILTVVARRAA